MQPWRAYEAEQQALARRADEKLKVAKRVPTLLDTTALRQWFLLGARQASFVQDWLLPWLRGAFRHCYIGPWSAGGREHLNRRRLKQFSSPRYGIAPRPHYDEEMFLQAHQCRVADQGKAQGP